jgi:hypothetical protein
VEPPAGGSPLKVVLDGGRLVNWLINESGNTPDYRNVPAMIAELANGDPRPIAREVVASLLGHETAQPSRHHDPPSETHTSGSSRTASNNRSAA